MWITLRIKYNLVTALSALDACYGMLSYAHTAVSVTLCVFNAIFTFFLVISDNRRRQTGFSSARHLFGVGAVSCQDRPGLPSRYGRDDGNICGRRRHFT